jgi:phosphatidylglycerophosphatase A
MRKLLATFFGIGLVPGPGGTYASAAAAALAMGAHHMGAPWWAAAGTAIAATVLSVWAGERALEIFGRKDPGPFVLDEVAGQLLAAMPLWMPLGAPAWLTIVAAFLWFRVLDIAKPPPIRQAEALPRGWGITMDDVLAGLLAGVFTAGTALLLGPVFDA